MKTTNRVSSGRDTWIEEEILQGHSDWVRDVAYAPSMGMPKTYLASASQVFRRVSAMCMLMTRIKR